MKGTTCVLTSKEKPRNLNRMYQEFNAILIKSFLNDYLSFYGQIFSILTYKSVKQKAKRFYLFSLVFLKK